MHTLSTLANFVGYKDWHDYVDSQLALLRPVSGILFDVDDALTKTPLGDASFAMVALPQDNAAAENRP